MMCHHTLAACRAHGTPALDNTQVLDNFQCHNKLTVDLGKKVNFVTGKNGTGKSACLQAIAIALGSQARDQARMNSIKEYVGPFHNKAVIQLHVIQPKDDMYKGKSAKGERFDLDQEIIIERTIAKVVKLVAIALDLLLSTGAAPTDGSVPHARV
jgi:predicted ATP-dependent endonuclease of OLD family